MTDADTFLFGAGAAGSVSTVTGFNGVGVVGGDKAHFSDQTSTILENISLEAGGWTTFSLDSGNVVKIQAVGLAEGMGPFHSLKRRTGHGTARNTVRQALQISGFQGPARSRQAFL